MATMERERPPLVLKDEREVNRQRLIGDAWAANAVRVLWAVGLIYLIGSLADIVLLLGVGSSWGNPSWEFTAMATTLEGTPRLVLAIALIWMAMYVRGTASLAGYRLFAVILIVLGTASAVFGAIATSAYFILRPDLPPEGAAVAVNVLLKTLTLSGLHTFLLVPVGVMGVRRPRA